MLSCHVLSLIEPSRKDVLSAGTLAQIQRDTVLKQGKCPELR